VNLCLLPGISLALNTFNQVYSLQSPEERVSGIRKRPNGPFSYKPMISSNFLHKRVVWGRSGDSTLLSLLGK